MPLEESDLPLSHMVLQRDEPMHYADVNTSNNPAITLSTREPANDETFRQPDAGRKAVKNENTLEDWGLWADGDEISERLSRINLTASSTLQNPSLATSSTEDFSVISLDTFALSSNEDSVPSPACGVAREAGTSHDPQGGTDPVAATDYDPTKNVSLPFQIPSDVLRKAMEAPPSSGAHYWQHALYRGPNGERVKIHYCKSLEATERVAQLFLDEEVIGFDIEWRPNSSLKDGPRKNVSLVQIASVDRIALFHIGLYPKREGECTDDLVAPSLKRVMESSNITKVGVAIKADCTRLRKFLGIQSQGLFELSHLYRLVKYSSTDVTQINRKLVQLAVIVEEHLQLPLWKGEVRGSDWSQSLDHRQISYAASDTYAGIHLYDIMEGKRKSMSPTPPRPAHAELNLPIRLCDSPLPSPSESSEDSVDLDEELEEDSGSSISDDEQVAEEIMAIATESPCIVEDIPAPADTKPARSPEVIAAQEWVDAWRANVPSKRKVFAAPASLRAYALWHHGHHSVSQCATLLRTPPLQSSTVAKYILDAVRSEGLEFEPDRLREVASIMPKDIFKSRYRSLNQRLFYF